MADKGAPPVRSFAQAIATDEGEKPLRSVQIDGLVALKISKHCTDCAPQLVTGLLLGLDVGSTLEVTNCFPFPSRTEGEEDDESDGAMYQLEMMRCLREVNVDNNTVGWYQSTLLGAYHTLDLIETYVSYRENIKRCVCIVFDAEKSAARGTFALKALMLKSNFLEVFKAGDLSAEKLRDKGITYAEIFEEIPVRLGNSTLVTSILKMTQPHTPEAKLTETDLTRLSLASASPLLEANLECMLDSLEEMNTEQQRLQYHYRSVQRQQQQQAGWLQKRRSENAMRRAAGEEPLPEEDPTNPIFKPIPEPSRVDLCLITNQIANYCDQLNSLAGPTLSKLYLMDALK